MEKNFVCENCNCMHDGSYGTGRFCSYSCARKWSAKQIKDRSYLNSLHEQQRAPFGRWKCNYCDFIAETRSKLADHKHTFHPEMMGKNNDLRPAWNKGLTKETDERLKKAGKKYKQGCAEGKYKKNSHQWTFKEKEKLSKIRSEWLMNHDGSGFKNVLYYKIRNINDVEFSVRGTWELKVAEKLNEMKILWERNHLLKYEVISDGHPILKNYNPDFYLPTFNEYIEVKGYYSDFDKNKMKLVKDFNKRC